MFRLISLSFIIFVKGAVVQEGGGRSWCYYDDPETCGPNFWEGDLCHNGAFQSPINLPFDDVLNAPGESEEIELNSKYSKSRRYILLNNGHTVQVLVNDDLTSDMKFTFQGKTYKFSQLHFHWGGEDGVGSEHTLNGRRFPLECHMVHHLDKYKGLNDAFGKEPGSVGVFTIFYTIREKGNKALTAIMESIEEVYTAGTRTTVEDLVLSDFLPMSETTKFDVVQYNGSLAYPPCTEGVSFLMFLRPQPVSLAQMHKFRSVTSDEEVALINNYRPIQPFNNREIKTYSVTVVPR